ncbi:lysophospholipid acyltransferase family protein [Timonella sp. A28]|uniref:lysophospholipid acyltransferase family protein n=1 Tax=Timonella sp. A28 TaxID=3442640 RepID=UPI003EBC8D65
MNTPVEGPAAEFLSAPLNPGKNLLYRVAAVIVRPIMFAIARRKWNGVDNIPDSGGIIVAANHASPIDPLMLAHYLYDADRPARILAKESLFRVPVLKIFMNRLNMIPVFRGTAKAAKSLEISGDLLDRGFCIAVFPEGTLTKDPDGWPMQARTGVARMALTTRKPVIPIGQWGQLDVLPRGAKFPKIFPRKTFYVAAGEPVDLSDLYDRDLNGQTLREATDRIMTAITELVAQQRGETAPATFFNPRA